MAEINEDAPDIPLRVNWHYSNDSKFRMLDNEPNSPINREELAEWNEMYQRSEVKIVLLGLLSSVACRNEEVPAAQPDTLSRREREQVEGTMYMLCRKVLLRSEEEQREEERAAHIREQTRLINISLGAPVIPVEREQPARYHHDFHSSPDSNPSLGNPDHDSDSSLDYSDSSEDHDHGGYDY